MPTYKEGSVWSARDAQYVWDGVEQLLGFYELDSLSAGEAGANIQFGKVKAGSTITPDVSDVEVELWDTSVSPPIAFDPPRTSLVTFDFLSDLEITEGTEIAWVRVGAFDRILWAECPPAEVVQTEY